MCNHCGPHRNCNVAAYYMRNGPSSKQLRVSVAMLFRSIAIRASFNSSCCFGLLTMLLLVDEDNDDGCDRETRTISVLLVSEV